MNRSSAIDELILRSRPVRAGRRIERTLVPRCSRPRRCVPVALLTIVLLAAAGPAVAGNLAAFGRCLAREGAVFYGASWCPHCRAQRQTLGDAMSGVRYVECSVGGKPDQTSSACQSAQIDGYPTWVFADGSRAGGEQSLAALAAKTGCSLSGSEDAAPAASNREHAAPAPQGPHIIDIPQE